MRNSLYTEYDIEPLLIKIDPIAQDIPSVYRDSRSFIRFVDNEIAQEGFGTDVNVDLRIKNYPYSNIEPLLNNYRVKGLIITESPRLTHIFRQNRLRNNRVSEIEYLRLSENERLSDYGSLRDVTNKLPYLNVLDLSHNDYTIAVIPEVRTVNLNNNSIFSILDYGEYVTETLDLSNNRLFIGDEFDPDTYDVPESEHYIHVTDEWIFSRMNDLKTLDLSGNDIHMIDLSAFGQGIESLNLSDNDLTSIYVSEEENTLKRLDIRDTIVNQEDIERIQQMFPNIEIIQ